MGTLILSASTVKDTYHDMACRSTGGSGCSSSPWLSCPKAMASSRQTFFLSCVTEYWYMLKTAIFEPASTVPGSLPQQLTCRSIDNSDGSISGFLGHPVPTISGIVQSPRQTFIGVIVVRQGIPIHWLITVISIRFC